MLSKILQIHYHTILDFSLFLQLDGCVLTRYLFLDLAFPANYTTLRNHVRSLFKILILNFNQGLLCYLVLKFVKKFFTKLKFINYKNSINKFPDPFRRKTFLTLLIVISLKIKGINMQYNMLPYSIHLFSQQSSILQVEIIFWWKTFSQ